MELFERPALARKLPPPTLSNEETEVKVPVELRQRMQEDRKDPWGRLGEDVREEAKLEKGVACPHHRCGASLSGWDAAYRRSCVLACVLQGCVVVVVMCVGGEEGRRGSGTERRWGGTETQVSFCKLPESSVNLLLSVEP